ncbi:MAG: HAD-IIIA family hydrolase [Nitrososphaera sp.]|nr:HAD-IIIA family hydrolase [Nitrososphaera sp.]
MKLVVFDVDGTLTPRRLASTAAFERKLLPGVEAKLATSKQQGIILALATNQGGSGRERSTRLSTGEVLAHLRWLQQALSIDAIRFATTEQRKKPKPAMITELMRQFSVTPVETLFVGDDDTDRLAAEAAGVQFVYANEFFALSANKSPDDLGHS